LPKKKSIKSARNDAISAFHQYVKYRDADFDGVCVCCTCGRAYRYDDRAMNAGHFRPAGSFENTRFNEQNVNAQCVRCNNWGGGMTYEYSRWLEGKHGKGTSANLERLGHIHCKRTIDDYLEIEKIYKEKLEQLKLEK